MLTEIFGFISSIIDPVVKMVDDLTTTDEERLEIKRKIQEANLKFGEKMLQYEADKLTHQADLIKAEITGKSWFQRNWRPLMMLWFAVLLGMYWFDVTPKNLSQETIDNLFTLLQVGIGGYIVGRSAEKIIPQIINKEKKNGTN